MARKRTREQCCARTNQNYRCALQGRFQVVGDVHLCRLHMEMGMEGDLELWDHRLVGTMGDDKWHLIGMEK